MKKFVISFATLRALPQSAAASSQRADLLFVNGKIVTVDGEFSIKSSVAVKDGRIVAVGGPEVARRFRAARTVDLGGRMLMPGFIDTHIHVRGRPRRAIAIAGVKSIASVKLRPALCRLPQAAGRFSQRRGADTRGNDGHFLCTAEGRNNIGRLPNVAFASLGDEELAGVLNFVVFSLSPGTAPSNAPPYTAVEVGQLRARPLNKGSLYRYREKVVANPIARCGAPEALRRYPPAGIH